MLLAFSHRFEAIQQHMYTVYKNIFVFKLKCVLYECTHMGPVHVHM